MNFAKSIGPDYWEKRKSVFDFRQDADVVAQPGQDEDLRRRPAGDVQGPAVPRGAEAAAKASATLRAKDGDAAELPAVVTRTHGKGRVVYFAGGASTPPTTSTPIRISGWC